MKYLYLIFLLLGVIIYLILLKPTLQGFDDALVINATTSELILSNIIARFTPGLTPLLLAFSFVSIAKSSLQFTYSIVTVLSFILLHFVLTGLIAHSDTPDHFIISILLELFIAIIIFFIFKKLWSSKPQPF